MKAKSSEILLTACMWLPVVSAGLGSPVAARFHIDAMISFTSTTIDDFAVMLYFMSLADLKQDEERSKAYVGILVAFFIGYSIVGATALISLLFGMVMSEKYIALAGFVPLLAGIHKVYESLSEQGYLDWCTCCGGGSDGARSGDGNSGDGQSEAEEHRRNRNELIKNYNMVDTYLESSDDDNSEESGLEVAAWKNDRARSHQHGNLPIKSSSSSSLSTSKTKGSAGGGSRNREGANKSGGNHGTQLDSNEEDDADADDDEYGDGDLEEADFGAHTGQRAPPAYYSERKFLGVFSWRVFRENMYQPLDWEVLMLTLASGSDHVVIYNAMLEDESDVQQVMISIVVYYIMLVVHVVAAIALIRCKVIARLFQTYSILLIIFLLIGTGVYILKDSVLFCNC
jgi:cadmium resistance protein CadD (predicted permease)